MFCSAVSRRKRGRIGTENKLLTCSLSLFHVSVYLSSTILCPFTIPPFSAAASSFTVSSTFPSTVLILLLQCADLLIIPMPLPCFCHFSGFLPTDPTGQLTVTASPVKWPVFSSFGKKKKILFSMLKLSLKKDKLRMSDLLSFLVLYVLLAISTFTVGSLCYQCHPFSNTLYSSSFLCLQSPALLLWNVLLPSTPWALLLRYNP